MPRLFRPRQRVQWMIWIIWINGLADKWMPKRDAKGHFQRIDQSTLKCWIVWTESVDTECQKREAKGRFQAIHRIHLSIRSAIHESALKWSARQELHLRSLGPKPSMLAATLRAGLP